MNRSSGTKIMREGRRSFANHLQPARFMLMQEVAYLRTQVFIVAGRVGWKWSWRLDTSTVNKVTINNIINSPG